MSTPTLTTKLANASLLATLAEAFPVSNFAEQLALSLNVALTNGTGANKANKLYSHGYTLASSSSTQVNLYSFDGAKDSLQALYVLGNVKLLLIQNRSTTDTLYVGNSGLGDWLPINETTGVPVKPLGYLLLIAPDATGLAVDGATSRLLNFQNTSGNSINFNLVVVGEQLVLSPPANGDWDIQGAAGVVSYKAPVSGPVGTVQNIEFESYLVSDPGTIIENDTLPLPSFFFVSGAHTYTTGQVVGVRARWLDGSGLVSDWSAEKTVTPQP